MVTLILVVSLAVALALYLHLLSHARLAIMDFSELLHAQHVQLVIQHAQPQPLVQYVLQDISYQVQHALHAQHLVRLAHQLQFA